MTSLDFLHPGDSGHIHAVEADAALMHRLSALGIRSGKHIKVIRRARFNGPMHVRIGMTDIILRTREANRIKISHTA
jgi:ferrous iron transport protein A